MINPPPVLVKWLKYCEQRGITIKVYPSGNIGLDPRFTKRDKEYVRTYHQQIVDALLPPKPPPVTRPTKVAVQEIEHSQLIAVVQLGKLGFARCFGDGRPRPAPKNITKTVRGKPTLKAGVKISGHGGRGGDRAA